MKVLFLIMALIFAPSKDDQIMSLPIKLAGNETLMAAVTYEITALSSLVGTSANATIKASYTVSIATGTRAGNTIDPRTFTVGGTIDAQAVKDFDPFGGDYPDLASYVAGFSGLNISVPVNPSTVSLNGPSAQFGFKGGK